MKIYTHCFLSFGVCHKLNQHNFLNIGEVLADNATAWLKVIDSTEISAPEGVRQSLKDY